MNLRSISCCVTRYVNWLAGIFLNYPSSTVTERLAVRNRLPGELGRCNNNKEHLCLQEERAGKSSEKALDSLNHSMIEWQSRIVALQALVPLPESHPHSAPCASETTKLVIALYALRATAAAPRRHRYHGPAGPSA